MPYYGDFRVLIVDDVADNIQVIMNTLKEESYKFSFATNGKQALELIKLNSFDLVLLDIMMPGIDGYEVCTQIKKDPSLKEIPIIFLTAKSDIDSIKKGFQVGGADYITKPFHADELLSRVKNQLELYRSKQILKYHNINLQSKLEKKETRLLSELEENQKEMIYILTELMEATSDETGKHIKRVAEYSRLLAHYHKSLSEEDANLIYDASPMHDIGKISIPHEILHKRGRLNEKEFEVMKTHSTIAYNLLKKFDRKILKSAAIIAHEHHERWDGNGYPRGLKGEDIHIYGRIVALADVFDALTHKRLYKEAWSIEASVAYIKEHSGKRFDPYLVEIFLEHLDEFIEISKI